MKMEIVEGGSLLSSVGPHSPPEVRMNLKEFLLSFFLSHLKLVAEVGPLENLLGELRSPLSILRNSR